LILVDTNVILDLVGNDRVGGIGHNTAGKGKLAWPAGINAVIYAELSVAFF